MANRSSSAPVRERCFRPPRASLTTVAIRLSVLLPVIACVGCGEDEPGFRIVSFDGAIERIDAGPDFASRITIRYYSEKHKKEVLGTSLVTRETEIMINGAVAKLSNLREGEPIHADVRIVTGRSTDQRNRTATVTERTVLRIVVDRPGPGGNG